MVGGSGGGGAAEFCAGEPGKRWLLLVQALHLEDVEEVERASVGADEVFGRLRGRLGVVVRSSRDCVGGMRRKEGGGRLVGLNSLS